MGKLTLIHKTMEEEKTINNTINTEGNTNKNSSNSIAGAIIIAGVIIAGAILLRGNTPTSINNEPNLPQPQAQEIKAVSQNEHIWGNPAAKIIIVEYSDLECPFCKIFHETMLRVVKERSDVAWVYRHYPIPQLHQKAFREAEATECAWEQGGNETFWEYINTVFEVTTSNDGLPESKLTEIAGSLGLNTNAFNNCLASGKYKSKVEADIASGQAGGVNGTPHSFILKNGKIVDTIGGALPYEGVLQKLNALK